MYFPLSYGRLLRGYVNDIFEWTSNAVMFSKPNQPTDHTRRSTPLAQNASDNFRVNIYEKRDQIEVDNQRT